MILRITKNNNAFFKVACCLVRVRIAALDWSPDRRNLLFNGSIGGRAGSFLVSALGGAPRYLNGASAAFYAGGDSLLIGPIYRPDSVFYVRVTALDGVARDSIRVVGNGQGMSAISVVPGTSWILTLIIQSPHGLWQVVDRAGKVADRVVNACTCGGIATSDAVWLARAGDGLEESVVRIAIDRSNGRLSTKQDTMAHGLFTQFSLTSDGSSMVMDEGTFDHSVWAVPYDDAVKGKLPDDRRIAHASSAVTAGISPDGSRLLLRRSVPTTGGHNENRYSVMPFQGGTETPLAVVGTPRRAVWSDSTTVAISSETPRGVHFAEVDVRTGATRNAFDPADSTVADFAPLSDGWAWVPSGGNRIVAMRNGQKREFPMSPWFAGIVGLAGDPAHHRILFVGFGKATGDSVGIAALSLDDGTQTLWASRFGESVRIVPLSTRGALFQVAETQDVWSLYTVDGPGKITPLGTVARPVISFSASADLSHATTTVRDYRADAWLSKVIRP